MQEQLTYVNAAGHAIIKVDNTTSGANDPTFGRPSVKLLSNATVPMGSLTIMDAVHMPFGVCVDQFVTVTYSTISLACSALSGPDIGWKVQIGQMMARSILLRM